MAENFGLDRDRLGRLEQALVAAYEAKSAVVVTEIAISFTGDIVGMAQAENRAQQHAFARTVGAEDESAARRQPQTDGVEHAMAAPFKCHLVECHEQIRHLRHGRLSHSGAPTIRARSGQSG